MKFPYGICDFKKIISSGFFYCDRTSHIPLLEQGKNQKNPGNQTVFHPERFLTFFIG